ncbi:phosphoribosylglycinamide formyltransferase [Niveibacterium terrae]|uniref:phosphoribosylglycinamide formyltransferase n=1 Tax=Niveibacterium terrae TaxID=3373598 RepID=UPI003A8DF656
MKNLLILISGRGSNMEAILNASIPGARICAVVANRPDAQGLAIARAAGVETRVLDHRGFADRAAFDAELLALIDSYSPDLVVLAGFMRVLGDDFVRHFEGRMINVHPSLLPSFTGLHTHRRALEAGVRLHGATVHFVTPALDGGPVVIQGVVEVSDADDEETLAAKVLEIEHRIYPQALRWFVEDRLSCAGGRVRLRGSAAASRSFCSPALDA